MDKTVPVFQSTPSFLTGLFNDDNSTVTHALNTNYDIRITSRVNPTETVEVT